MSSNLIKALTQPIRIRWAQKTHKTSYAVFLLFKNKLHSTFKVDFAGTNLHTRPEHHPQRRQPPNLEPRLQSDNRHKQVALK